MVRHIQPVKSRRPIYYGRWINGTGRFPGAYISRRIKGILSMKMLPVRSGRTPANGQQRAVYACGPRFSHSQ